MLLRTSLLSIIIYNLFKDAFDLTKNNKTRASKNISSIFEYILNNRKLKKNVFFHVVSKRFYSGRLFFITLKLLFLTILFVKTFN